MKKRIFKEENYKLSKWSGGSTRELAIYPANAEYLNSMFPGSSLEMVPGVEHALPIVISKRIDAALESVRGNLV